MTLLVIYSYTVPVSDASCFVTAGLITRTLTLFWIRMFLPAQELEPVPELHVWAILLAGSRTGEQSWPVFELVKVRRRFYLHLDQFKDWPALLAGTC